MFDLPTPQVFSHIGFRDFILSPPRVAGRSIRATGWCGIFWARAAGFARACMAPWSLAVALTRISRSTVVIMAVLGIPCTTRYLQAIVMAWTMLANCRGVAEKGVFLRSTPAIASGKDIFDTFIRGKLQRRPRRSKRFAVNVLLLSCITHRLDWQRRKMPNIVGLSLFLIHDTCNSAEDATGAKWRPTPVNKKFEVIRESNLTL